MDENGAATEPREDRGPRIPPAKIASIKPEPTLSIFYKPTKTATLQLLDNKFSRDAAMIFCDRIRHDLMDNQGKSFTITGGDLTGLKEVLEWIEQCVAEESIVKYKEIDENTPNLFTLYANVIISATYLGIPARDLGDGLTKRMQAIARKVLMGWDEVEWFYKTPTLNTCSETVRDTAAASVFWGWWTAKLNEEDTPEDMMHLDVLRQEIPKLDQDLHDWCERNEQDVRNRWEEKKKAKQMGDAGGNGLDAGGHDLAAPADGGGGGGGGWDTGPALSSTNGAGVWDALDVKAGNIASGGWDAAPQLPMSVADTGFDSGVDVGTGTTTPAICKEEQDGGDWADEVNQHDGYHSQQW